MERLEKIGFDKLVHICCAQIPRHLCGQFMDSFDPPTKNVAIRGKSFHLRPEDVKQLMGLPCGGGEIERKARKDDKAFKSLKRSYGSSPIQDDRDWIIESTVEEQFEILFVIYALGTLLCPTASIKVSDALLKVIVATKEDFREFDWCTFVLNELCNSIGDYKSKIRKGKGTVTGTQYILEVIYCLQNFPLGPLQAPTVEDAIHFWDDTKIKRRVKIERESKKGLLLPYGDEVGQSSTELQPETALTHPEIKRTYDRIMSRVREELLALQARLFKGAESDVNDEVQSEDEEPCSQNEEDGEEDEDEGSKPNGEDEGSESKGYTSQEGEQSEHNNDSTEDELNVGEEFKNLRKSTRIKRPAIGSPWVVTTVGKKRPKHENDKKALYQLCTTRCTEEEELE
ncbi:hypothetical protein K1719_046455 [Acacia pycnantha]|nr:hypothetical protein K1719_046455 [Acacia pycnantha]